jgi:hypothetical protein
MKKFILVAVFLCCFQYTFSQVKKEIPEAPKSKLESFSENSGTMLKKEFFDVAIVKGVQFEVLKLTDMSNNSVEAGLRISATLGSGSYLSSYVAFLDKDEIDGFEKAIDYMLTNVSTSSVPVNNIEYRYMSRSGFSATVYNGSGTWSSKKTWRLNLRLEKYISASNAYLTAEELPKIKEAIAAAKLKLQSI